MQDLWPSCTTGCASPSAGLRAVISRARVDPHVDAVLAAVDVAAVVSTVRGTSPVATSWPKPAGTCWRPCAARSSHAASTTTSPTVPCPAIPASPPLPSPPAGTRSSTSSSARPASPSPIAGGSPMATAGRPPRESSRYERARVAGLAVQNAIRAARTPAAGRDDAPAATASAATHTEDRHRDQPPDAPHAVDAWCGTQPSPRRSGPPPPTPTRRPRCPRSTWRAVRPARRVDAHTAEPGKARCLHPHGRCPSPRRRGPAEPRAVGRRGQARRPATPHESARPRQGSGP